MARRKTFPSLLLFALLLLSLLASSNSTSLTSIPYWASNHQLQTLSPEFNVVATDGGVPTLETGEKPAKDPQIIVEGPLPIDTPDPINIPNPPQPFDDGEIIDSTPIPPSYESEDDSLPLPKGNGDSDKNLENEPSPEDEEELDHRTPASDDNKEVSVTPSHLPKPSTASPAAKTPKVSKKPKPSGKSVSDKDQPSHFSDSESGNPNNEQASEGGASPELEVENGVSSGSTSDQQPFGPDSDNDTDFLPEPSLLPDYPSPSKPPTATGSLPSAKPSNSSKGKHSDSVKPSVANPSALKPSETPKSFLITSPVPTTTALVSNSNPSASAEVVVEGPNEGDLKSEGSEIGPEPSLLVIDGPDASLPPTATASVPNSSNTFAPTAVIPTPGPSSGNESVSPTPLIPSSSSSSGESEDMKMDDSYSCVFFGEGVVPKFSSAKPELFSGTVDTYATQANFGTLPPQYLSHTFGKAWNYSLPTNGGLSYDIVVGFAEIYQPACGASVDSGFRLFSVSVGTQSVDIDVMGTVGCGKPLHKMFPKVSPHNGFIKLQFEAIAQNAMLSTMCYRESEVGSDGKVQETPISSASPELPLTEATPTPEKPTFASSSTTPKEDDNDNKIDDQFVQPNATYTCVNFATKTFASYQLFDESSMDGSYVIYKGSGVALNPTLPMPYRYHAYGEKWTYHLNVMTNMSQNVILGFAEVFPKACASGKHGSFRVFTASVGDKFQIVDVMRSSGCGVVMQAVFENVKPYNQVIDMDFNAISGKAMLSVACYGDANATNEETDSTETPEPNATAAVANPGASPENSKQSKEQCFQFGDDTVAGFTSFSPTELGKDVQVYTDEFAVVKGTSDSEVYKSHIFGPEFTLTLDAGASNSITVELGFAEIYVPGCKEGFRVFTVQAGSESKRVDVFKEAGCKTAFTFQLQNIPKSVSGEVEIVFKAVANFAMVSSVCIFDDEGTSDSGTSPSLVSISGTEGTEESLTQTDGESTENNTSGNQIPLPSEESPEQSVDPEVGDGPNAEQVPPQGSPFPKENGLIVVNSSNADTSSQGNPAGSPLPKVNGVIDASITISPAATASPAPPAQPELGTEENADNGEGGEQSGDPGSAGQDTEEDSIMNDEGPQPSDELLPSDFSQTTVGEDSNEQPISSPDPTNVSSDPSSYPALFGASGSDNGSPSPTPSVFLSSIENPVPNSGAGDTSTVISPTKTPIPTVALSPSSGGGNDSVTNKQGDVTIEAPSPSPTVLAVVIETPSPASSGLNVTIEAPSPSSSANSVTIIGAGPGTSESSAPTPTIISAAAFSPAPSAAVPPPSPSSSLGESGEDPSSTTPQPLVTAVEPDVASAEPQSAQSASPAATQALAGDEVLPPVDSTPTGAADPASSPTSNPNDTPPPSSQGTSEGDEILTPASTSPSPQGDPDGSGPTESASSPPPAATITQNQIIVIPSASPLAIPTRTPNPLTASPPPSSSPVTDPGGTASGIGAPDGVVTASAAPDSTTSIPSGSPIPDVVTNPSVAPGSSPQATPSPSRATSSVGSNEVIVDSQTSAPSPYPEPSISVGAPDEGPVEVSDNNTNIIEVTGDIGTGGPGEDNQPSILVGEYKDIIATTPAGSGFAIGMGIVGALLVLLLLVCLFFAIFRGGGAAYPYSSGYSSHKSTDYDPSQGRYTDDLGLGPAGYGNEPSYGQNTQDGYVTDPVTFESRPEGQSEAFGFEMPAVGGLGASEVGRHRNDEPDTIAEYSSLNLQQASGYDAPLPETTVYRGSREADMEQTTQNSQFQSVNASRTDKTTANDSYGSNPGEYTFTGTFTMPNTRYSQSQRNREYEDNRDPGPAETKPHFRGSTNNQDSFNDHHSVARPTTMSESSGKQERVPKNITNSEIMPDSTPASESRTEFAPLSQDGALVDDVRSSLLDSAHASSSYKLSMGSNPVAAQSPYETQLNVNMADSDSGNVVALNLSPSGHGAPAHLTQNSAGRTQLVANQNKIDTELPAPMFAECHNELTTGAANSAQTYAVRRSVLPSSGSNDEPWPWWWSGENMRQHEKSPAYTDSDHRTDGKENSSLSSNGIMNTAQYRYSASQGDQKIGADVSAGTDAKSDEIQTAEAFVPDSSWRRQYSSTSDEGEEDSSSNPYFEELRRRREPYVRSVANRLSTGLGSFSKAVPESIPEKGKQQFAVEKNNGNTLGPVRELSSWITQDLVEV